MLSMNIKYTCNLYLYKNKSWIDFVLYILCLTLFSPFIWQIMLEITWYIYYCWKINWKWWKSVSKRDKSVEKSKWLLHQGKQIFNRARMKKWEECLRKVSNYRHYMIIFSLKYNILFAVMLVKMYSLKMIFWIWNWIQARVSYFFCLNFVYFVVTNFSLFISTNKPH